MDIYIDFSKDYSEARALEDNEMIRTQIMGQAMSVFDRLYNQSKVFSEDPCKELYDDVQGSCGGSDEGQQHHLPEQYQ